MHFFVWQYILDWIKNNALKSLGECIVLLWSIETVSYWLLLLFSEWTAVSIVGNMCSKYLDEQYTPDIVFLFCAALFFILMSLLQMHYRFFSLVWSIRQKCFQQFFIENVCRLLCKLMLLTMFIKICES